MSRETWAQARTRILAALAARGWTTRPALKTPWAERDRVRLTFTPQSVHLNGRSMWLDLRGMHVDVLIAHAVRWTAERHDVEGGEHG